MAHSSASEDDCRPLRVTHTRSQGGPDVYPIREELHGPPGTEVGNVVLPVDLLGLLPARCHPQAFGHLLHWYCGGGSPGLVPANPFGCGVPVVTGYVF